MPDQHIKTLLNNAKQLYTEQQVCEAVDNMAAQITAVMAAKDPIILCVMVGGVVFAGQLLPKLNFPLQVDYIHATRYGGETQGGELKWLVEPKTSLKNRNILLVDDIFDKGVTLSKLVDFCKQHECEQVYSAVLVKKLCERDSSCHVSPDFSGLTTPDAYVFGSGMDYHEYWRNAAGVYMTDA